MRILKRDKQQHLTQSKKNAEILQFEAIMKDKSLNNKYHKKISIAVFLSKIVTVPVRETL
jgi:hypothetical protein